MPVAYNGEDILASSRARELTRSLWVSSHFELKYLSQIGFLSFHNLSFWFFIKQISSFFFSSEINFFYNIFLVFHLKFFVITNFLGHGGMALSCWTISFSLFRAILLLQVPLQMYMTESVHWKDQLFAQLLLSLVDKMICSSIF